MSSLTKHFHVLLFQLSEKLHPHDIEGIITIEELPADLEGQSALKILLKLEMMGRISASKLSDLEEVFKNINRIDLARKVKDFSKTQKKGTRRSASTTMQGQEQSLYANLEVTLVQMRLLLDQLKHLKRIAQEASPKYVEPVISEAQEDAEALEKKLLHAKALQNEQSLDSSGSDTGFSPPINPKQRNSFDLELEQHLASRKTPPRTVPMVLKGSDCEARAAGDQIAPILPTNASRAPEGTKLASQEESEAEMYAEVIHPRLIVKSAEDSACFESVRPRLIKDQDNGRGNSALVTGALDKQAGPKCRKKPVPPPKPMKFLKFSSKDVINESESDYEDEANYTGTTGDSGFADPMPFLRVDLTSPQQSITHAGMTAHEPPMAAGYYKAINREEVGGPTYYKLANRESQTHKFQEIMKNEPTKPREKKPENQERIYENYPPASHTL